MRHASPAAARSIPFLLLLLVAGLPLAAQEPLRAPAYPLVTHNPNFSLWSMGDSLAASHTKHWTEVDQDLLGLVEVDGTTYRFLGMPPIRHKTILAAADEGPAPARYTERRPRANWIQPEYDDSGWSEGSAPFTDEEEEAGTPWTSEDLWYRRSFDLETVQENGLLLKIRHDDDVTVYLNGEQIFDVTGWQHSYKYIPVPESAILALRPEGNVLAIHIRNTAGGQWLDAGLVRRVNTPEENRIQEAKQTDVTLTANQTIYRFDCGPVDLTVTFTSPLLLEDLTVYARPITYLDVNVDPRDGAEHDVSLYLGLSGDIARTSPGQELRARRQVNDGLSVLQVGTTAQPVLEKKGDDLRIDWGYAYLAAPAEEVIQFPGDTANSWLVFLRRERPRTGPYTGGQAMLSTVSDLGTVSGPVSRTFLLGYDERESIHYFGSPLEPWYKKEATAFPDLLTTAWREHDAVLERVRAFDERLAADARAAGGDHYADLCVLAYRQALAAHTLVESPEGELLYLSKENNSNGSINTVDVTYPSAPLFLVYNPDLLKGMLNGIFYYSESGRWTKPFAAHDLGTYPIATGQTYGEDMPVEEAGNMLILTAAIADREGNADYASLHWETLTTWADYLRESGFDPENQLSTDDFSGHLARNANLSVKAILGLASYGKLAGLRGDTAVAGDFTRAARDMARQWMRLADDGDHYSLTFEGPGTWSQKYNLVWDELLGLDIFPDEVIDTEIAYYLTRQNAFGLPLDSRDTYTKSDWILWTATMARNQEDFTALMEPVWSFAHETPERVPLTDWHDTVDARRIGFKARSVVGGYFIKLLKEQRR